MLKTDWAKVIEFIVKAILAACLVYYGVRRLLYGKSGMLNLDDPLQVRLLFFFILDALLFAAIQMRKSPMK